MGGGLSALGAALYSIGIPRDSIVEYETALKSDKFLLMVHGTADEVALAQRILETTGAVYIATHEGICVTAQNHSGRDCMRNNEPRIGRVLIARGRELPGSHKSGACCGT